MDMFSSLFSTGQAEMAKNMQTMGVPAVPKDASQLYVPQQAMDLSTVSQAAGEQVAKATPTVMSQGSPMSGLLSALTSAGVNAMGNKKKQEAPMAPLYRGGSSFSNPGANSLSSMRLAGSPNLRGILNG